MLKAANPVKKSDNLIARFSKMSEKDVYKLVAEYLNALAFQHDAFMYFSPVIQAQNNSNLKNIKYMSDEIRSYDGFTCIPYPCLIANIGTEEQAQLISLYVQAKTNKNPYFKVLFYWHSLVYPHSNENIAIDYINNNKDKTIEFYTKHIEKSPIFAVNGTIEKSLGNYIKWGVRHSIAHMTRTEENAVSLELEDWEQIMHIGTIAAILEDIAKYRIENDFNVKGYPSMEALHEFDPDESLLQR